MTHAFWSDSPVNAGAYRLLEHAVGQVYGLPCPEVKKDGRGKPYFPARPDIFFSLSHTRGAVMVCLSDAPCGCDIERERPVRDSVLRRVCTPEELAQFDFFELWTLKESFYKLRGGSDAPMWEARFARSGAAILAPDPAAACALQRLAPYYSAVATLSPPILPPIFIPKESL